MAIRRTFLATSYMSYTWIFSWRPIKIDLILATSLVPHSKYDDFQVHFMGLSASLRRGQGTFSFKRILYFVQLNAFNA